MVKSDLRFLANWGAIKYVPISDEEGLFIFKKPGGNLRNVVAVYDGKHGEKDVWYSCALFIKNRLIYPSEKNTLEFYIEKYRKAITYSPEFLISNILDENLKLQSPEYVRPIRDFFRRINLLDEKRGKIKKKDPITSYLDEFLIKEFTAVKKKKPLPIKFLQEKLTEEVIKKNFSEKYFWSDITIRRKLRKAERDDFIIKK